MRRYLLGMALAVFCFQVSAATKQQAISQPKEDTCIAVKEYNEKNQTEYFRQVCPKDPDFRERAKKLLSTITPDKTSALQTRIQDEDKIEKERYGIVLYEPTYILPFYYTGSPYQSIYTGTTPDDQPIMQEELKMQWSLKIPIWNNMFSSSFSLDASYTQLSYWQVYAKSQYFRETDYELALFVSKNFMRNWLGNVGIVHQSNGRGGDLERSWNRLFFQVEFSGTAWIVGVKPWILIMKSESSDLHNPNIEDYLGYGKIFASYKFARQEVSLMFRNVLESGLSRGTVELDYAFPIHGLIEGYVQFFSGYGQSLIEYDHYTNSFGVGIVINNWI